MVNLTPNTINTDEYFKKGKDNDKYMVFLCIRVCYILSQKLEHGRLTNGSGEATLKVGPVNIVQFSMLLFILLFSTVLLVCICTMPS